MGNRLAKNAAFNMLYRLLNVIFPLISATYIARILGPNSVGKVTYVQNIASYFVMFAGLGIPVYGTREIAKSKDNTLERNRIFSELFLLNAISSAVALSVYSGFVLYTKPDEAALFLVFGLDLALNFINIDWLYQGEEEYAYITVRSIAVKVLSLAGLFLFVRQEQDYIVYGSILCLGSGGNHVFNLIHARKKVKLYFKRLDLKRHLKPVLFLLLSSAAASLYSKVDITMLGIMSSSEAVAFYSTAHKVISIVLTLVTAFSAVFLPRLSCAYKENKNDYCRYLSSGLQLVLSLAVPSCVGMFIVAGDLVEVFFGEAYNQSAVTLQILSLFSVIKGVGDLLCYQAVISSGNEKMLVGARVAAGIANILMNGFLIPHFGHNGAAVASVISELIVNSVLLKKSLDTAKPKVGRQFFVSLFASTAAMIVCVLITQHFMRSSMAQLTVTVIIGSVSYFFFAVLTKNPALTFFTQEKNKR